MVIGHLERAEKFRLENGSPWCGQCDFEDYDEVALHRCPDCARLVSTLAAAFAEVEAAAWEKTAEVADTAIGDRHATIASKIRALRRKP